jgi:hypothetical protein
LLLIAGAYLLTNLSRTWLFWLAFILTRPLGAAVGDILTKPVADGGFNLSRISSSLAIALVHDRRDSINHAVGPAPGCATANDVWQMTNPKLGKQDAGCQ